MNGEKDQIVGLDVCGKIFYCHQSTLSQISPYFARRFNGTFDAGLTYRDSQNRPVYFVERDPQVFPYIFKYMIAPACSYHLQLPTYASDKALFRSLRTEADFFGLEGLSELLHTTVSFSPDEGNQGVLYWLGCRKGTTMSYQNPYVIGAIHVGGWVDDEAANQQKAMFALARSASCRANFVQYQQPAVLVTRGAISRVSIESYNYLLWCDHGMERLPVVVDLKSISLRPTHYSLRVSQCYGMQGDWNFEASVDGITWDVLHAARNDQYLCLSESSDIITKLDKSFPLSSSDEQRSEALLRLIEQDYRHTWELSPTPTQYYCKFRIIGAGSENDVRDNCLHGEGLYKKTVVFALFGLLPVCHAIEKSYLLLFMAH